MKSTIRVFLIIFIAGASTLLMKPELAVALEALPSGETVFRAVQQDQNEDDDEAPAVQVFGDFEASVWASYPMVANPVAIDFDSYGRAYVTETTRRRNSDLPIRGHMNWDVEGLSFRSTDDKRAFIHTRLAPSRSEENEWLPDRNGDGVRDWHDLMVQTETIQRLADTDGDGTADTSIVFAKGFNTEITGVGAGVMAFDEAVYFTVTPDLWKLRDTNGDGRADERESLVSGFGVHFGYSGHDMHGLTVGPDGRIYWSIGDVGLNITGPDGRQWVYPNQGAVMRINPDGTGFEVFAHGLRNPMELAFDKYGNLFSVDNDSDRPGDHERIVYITEGSDSGWRTNWQFGKYDNERNSDYNVWIDERLYHPYFEGQAAYITPPVAQYYDGPAGFAYNPGTALSDRWDDYFFVSLFTGSTSSHLRAFSLEQKGATFELVDDQKVVEGILTAGIGFSPGGALYLAEWGLGWTVGEKGRIWKLDIPGAADSDIRQETENLIRTGMNDRSLDELSRLLHHEDMRVRMRAQFELVERGSDGVRRLLAAARQPDHLLARLHGIWGIGQLGRERPEAVQPLVPLLNDEHPEVRAQAAKVIGEANYSPAVDDLIPLLEDPEARPRFFAAMALGKLGDMSAFEPIVEMLAANAGEDPYLRHAGVMGMVWLGDSQAIADLHDHESEAVRLAAVVALRRLRDEAVEIFLDDPSEQVRVEAARAIHDDFSIEPALPELAQMLEREGLTNEALLRRAINANFRLGEPQNARRLAAFAARESAPALMRAEALACLSLWPDPPPLDRVTGRYRGLGDRDRSVAVDAIDPIMDGIWSADSDTVLITATTVAARLDYQPAAPSMLAIVADRSEPAHVRTAALAALGDLEAESLEEAINLALASNSPMLRQEGIRLMAVLNPSGQTAVSMYQKVLRHGTMQEKQYALEALGNMEVEHADALLSTWMDRLLAGKVDKGIRLDLLAAVRQSGSETLSAKMQQYKASKPDTKLAAYRETLFGGDAQNGRQIVFEHPTAQCMRCHSIDGEGGAVGPPLTTIGADADRQYILESLIMPSAEITPGYGTVSVTLDDGTTISGTVHEEANDYVVLQTGHGTLRKVAKSKIIRRTSSPSAMPAMGAILSKSQIRDVIEYLAGLESE